MFITWQLSCKRRGSLTRGHGASGKTTSCEDVPALFQTLRRCAVAAYRLEEVLRQLPMRFLWRAYQSCCLFVLVWSRLVTVSLSEGYGEVVTENEGRNHCLLGRGRLGRAVAWAPLLICESRGLGTTARLSFGGCRVKSRGLGSGARFKPTRF